MFRMLQQPLLWPTAGSALKEAIDGNGHPLLLLHAAGTRVADLERQAVSCNDAPKPPLYVPPTNEQLVDEILGVSKEVTRFAFSVLTTEPDAQCHYWPVTPPERFTGPWNHTLRNPTLVLSNTADPVTPIASARLVKELLGDSAALLLQNGPGHVTSSVPTLCTINKIRAYFTDGVIPDENEICQLDEALFPGSEHQLGKYTEDERTKLEAAETLHALMMDSDLSAFQQA
ncbi:hypothetical protein DACRYDRAFT_85260 [Dacryopinax primogenitus]|uniref:Peptidase S33 tripeptidyl aminopeptidase-like C-terminal domain-containing protein n=1 Tax=Dacryopinax primogenitus (strain DJM 731) TaxID=1858805 RepID=M5FUE9_DACPD|nr:uncharacterized protein DACRYDRAFT_85260 [Dacryopinax primogenitus]EJT96861.1 hypothetical protein DACRYDRAFT_85260 [Dacryopinax primogenitus]